MMDVLNVVILLVFVAVPAIVLHEVAHGFVANALGDPTAKSMGRLTFNPIKHVDLLGSIVIPGGLFLAHYFGLTKTLMLFGWAKPVPVNFRQLKPRRLGMVCVAVAGPLVNILLAFIFITVYKSPWLSHWAYVLEWGILLNLTLAVFNLVPIPPLDGSRVVLALLPPQLAYYYSSLEPFGLWIVVILLQLGMMQFLYPVMMALGSLLGVQV
jgi:Zn-dependent protease